MLFVQAFEKISSGTEAGGDHEGQGDIVSEETETMHEPHEEGGELEILEDDRHAAHEPRARVPMSTMSIHRRWVPRYGLYLSHIFIVSITVCSNLMFHFCAAGYALRVFSRLRDLWREIW